MAFYLKFLLITLFGVFASFFALAQNKDFLSITGSISSGQIIIDSVEQRVFEQNVTIYKSGSYEARLLKGKKIVSNNFFEIEENPELWVDVKGNKPEERFLSDRSAFNIKLPLTGSLDVASSIIEIWKGNSLLYSKKLIELPMEVLAVETYIITNQKNSPSLSYLFHLYYDNGQIFADRDFEFKYDVIPEEFKPEVLTTQFPFSGEVVNLKGETAATFKFDPRRGNPAFLKGKISVKAPYAPDGKKVVFYDVQDKPLLAIFVDESSFCNDDGICNVDRGEDKKTCPNDCAGVLPTTLPPPYEKGPAASGLTTWIILTLVFVGAGLGGWYWWKWWQKKKAATQINQFTNKLN